MEAAVSGGIAPATPQVTTLELLEGAIRLSAPFVAIDPRRMPEQLVGRLAGARTSEIGHFLEHVLERAPRPWLCPLTPSLWPSGGPLERIIIGHTDWVSAVAVTPDGARIVSASRDTSVRVWDPNGRPERTLSHTSSVNTVAISADGARIVSGCQNGIICCWDLASGELERTLKGSDASVQSVAVTPDGTQIIEGSWDGTVRVWDLASGNLERSSSHPGPVTAVAVAPDGRRIISASNDNKGGKRTVWVWDLSSGQLERTLEGHTGEVRALAVTADGARLISGSEDHTAKVWDLAGGRLESTLNHPDYVFTVAPTRDGQRVVSAGRDGNVRLWDLAGGRLERILDRLPGGVSCVAVAPDDARAISGNGNAIQVWDLSTVKTGRTLEGYSGSVEAAVVAPDGTRLVSGNSDATVRVWSLETGRLERTFEGHAGSVRALAMTRDGRRMISGGSDGKLLVWDPDSGVLERTLDAHARGLLQEANAHAELLWDQDSSRLTSRLAGPAVRSMGDGPVTAVAVTPDGGRIVSVVGRKVLVWDLASGRLELTLDGSVMALSPDGSRIATDFDSRRYGPADTYVAVVVRDLASGQLECTLDVPSTYGKVIRVVFAADGRRLVTVHDPLLFGPHEAVVWDLAGGRLERALEGHTGYLTSLAPSPDPRRVLSSTNDGVVTVWDLESGQEIASWRPDPGIQVKAYAHPTDPSLVVVGDSLGGIHLVGLLEDQGPTPPVHRPWGRPPVPADAPAHPAGVPAGGETNPDVDLIGSAGSEDRLPVPELSGRLERTFESHRGRVSAAVVTPDGRRIISAGDDRTVRVWGLATGRLERTLEGNPGPVDAIALTPDGVRLVSAGLSFHGEPNIRLWNLSSGRLERAFLGLSAKVEALAVTPDGRRIISAEDGAVCIRDLASGRLERTLEPHTSRIGSLAVSPDGLRLVARDIYGKTRIWGLAGGLLERTIEGGMLGAVALAPDSARIITGETDGTMRVWDLASGRHERKWEGQTRGLLALAFMPEGTQIVSFSADLSMGCNLSMWDLSTGQPLGSARPGQSIEAPTCCEISVPANLVVLGDSTGRVYAVRLFAPAPAPPEEASRRLFGLLKR